MFLAIRFLVVKNNMTLWSFDRMHKFCTGLVRNGALQNCLILYDIDQQPAQPAYLHLAHMCLFSGGHNGTSAKVRKKSLSSSQSSRSAILHSSNGINRWASYFCDQFQNEQRIYPLATAAKSSWGKMAACDFRNWSFYCFQFKDEAVVWSVKDETPSSAHWSNEHIRW